jgi:class 3 adenylate cyclase/tetratricopeptide (TPR) repeat protein
VDIKQWLQRLSLGRYAQSFAENDIDFEVLPDLTDQDLEKIGVTSLGHRRKLLRAIANLRGVDQITPAAAVATALPITPLGADAAERRQVTVMVSDLVGSTALSARMDLEDLQELISVYKKCVAETVRRFGGFVAQYLGDGVLIYFGYPEAHEDDAERAVRAGLELIAAVGALKTQAPLQTRVGIATGLVVVGDLNGSGDVQGRGIVGETPNLAARLQGIAEPNTVLIAESTRGLLGNLFELEDLGARDLKDVAEPVRAWTALRASTVESRFEALHPSGLTALVGREEETELLLRRWSQAKSGEGQVVLISGEPGIGKSRLTAALLESLAPEPHTRLRYFCAPQHTDSAFYPIVGQMERAAGLLYDDAPRQKLDKLDAALAQSSTSIQDAALIAQMLSLPNDGRYPALELTPRQRRLKTMEALTAQIETLSRQKPVLMILEDAHWVDPTSLEAFSRVVERIRRLRVLLLVTFRLEFDAPWVRWPHVTTRIINRLAEHQAGAMIDRIAGNKQLSASIRQDIIERTDGIPLFVEEMTKAVLEAGSETAAARAIAAVPSPALAVPASLHASLMARLDRLGGSAKELAQIGAAIGREFSHALLASVVRQPKAELRSALDRLIAAGLLLQQGAPPHATYLFKHALVQDAAYGTLLRETRRQLHGRIAKALEDRFPDIVQTQPELVAHHCERAELGEMAVRYWLKAGAIAVSRSANLEAISHLHNGLQRLNTMPQDDKRARLELDLHLTLGQALIAARGYTAGDTTAAFARAEELVEKIGDMGQRYSVLYGIFVGRLIGGHIEAASETIDRLCQLAASDEDDAYLCLAHRLHGSLLFFRGDLPIACEYLQKTVALYGPLQQQKLAFHFGPDTGSAAQIFLAMTEWLRGRPESALRTAQNAIGNARRLENALTLGQVQALAAQLHYMSQDYEGMLRLSREGRDNCERVGILYFGAICRLYQTWSEAWRSNPGDYIEEFHHGLAIYEEMRGGLQLGLFHNMLAQLLLAAGAPAEAAKEAETALAKVTVNGERWWTPEIHRTLGDVLLALPNPNEAEAESCYGRAIAEARDTGALMLELRAATSLARMMVRHGDEAKARRALAAIFAQFNEGFDSIDLRAAQTFLTKKPQAAAS